METPATYATATPPRHIPDPHDTAPPFRSLCGEELSRDVARATFDEAAEPDVCEVCAVSVGEDYERCEVPQCAACDSVQGIRRGYMPELVDVPLDLLDDNPFQARRRLTGIDTLAASIERGLQSPPMARPWRDRFQLAMGHRRVESMRWLRKRGRWGDTAPVYVQALNDREMAEVVITENAQRVELSVTERLAAWASASRAGLTHQQIADASGLKRATLTGYMALARLPAEFLSLIDRDVLKMGAARVLLRLVCDRTLAHANPMIGYVVYGEEGLDLLRGAHPGERVDIAVQRIAHGDMKPPTRLRMESRMAGLADQSRSVEQLTGWRTCAGELPGAYKDLCVHRLPASGVGGGIQLATCQGEELAQRLGEAEPQPVWRAGADEAAGEAEDWARQAFDTMREAIDPATPALVAHVEKHLASLPPELMQLLSRGLDLYWAESHKLMGVGHRHRESGQLVQGVTEAERMLQAAPPEPPLPRKVALGLVAYYARMDSYRELARLVEAVGYGEE